MTTSEGSPLLAPAEGDCWIWSSEGAVTAAAWVWRDGFYWCQSWPAQDLVERAVARAAVFEISPGEPQRKVGDELIIRLNWLRILLALADSHEYQLLVEREHSLGPRGADGDVATALVRRLVASGLTEPATLTSLSWPALTVETATVDPDPQAVALIVELDRRLGEQAARRAAPKRETHQAWEAAHPPRDPVEEQHTALIDEYGTRVLTEEDFISAVMDGVTQWHLRQWVHTLIDAVSKIATPVSPTDAFALADLLGRTLELRRRDVNPFAALMEAPRSIGVLHRAHREAMTELTVMRDRAYDPLLRDLAAALYRQPSTPILWRDLIEHGATPIRPPEPDIDDWEPARPVAPELEHPITETRQPMHDAVTRLLEELQAAGADLHNPAGQPYVGLRTTGPIAVYARPNWASLAVPADKAAEVLARGHALVEKKGPATWYLRYPGTVLEDPAAYAEARDLALEHLGLTPTATIEETTGTAPDTLMAEAPTLAPRGAGEAHLALSVARCPQVPLARADSTHPCSTIVSLQPADPSIWQVPEPWAGNLTEGRVIFISSNPSINEDEDYPRGDWPDEKIADFVTNRFSHGWVHSNRVLLRDGTYYPHQVRFWLSIRQRATELLGRDADPAADYAMTEVVHCKSRDEIGVSRASALCVSLHLDRIIAASPAPLVVVVGHKSRDRLIPLWDLPAQFGARTPVGSHERANLITRELGGHNRVVAYLPHPNNRETNRHFAGFYPTALPALQRLAQGQLTPDDFLAQLP